MYRVHSGTTVMYAASCLPSARSFLSSPIHTSVVNFDVYAMNIVSWVALDVPQCGYCQAGQIMSCAALLARTPNPSDEEIVAAMNGNICRCGTYVRVKEAVRRATTLTTTANQR